MHAALLIDEILQPIFEYILEDGKPSLCHAARCCQAWRDPALDRVWRRLPSAVPLLSLLPGFLLDNGVIRLSPLTQDVAMAAFRSYAIRVRHIVHQHPVFAEQPSTPTELSHLLSNLESTRVEFISTGEVAMRMSLTPRLRSLVLRIGYGRSKSISKSFHDAMSLLENCTSLEKLSIRGRSSEFPHAVLSSVTNLRSLSLHLSFVTEQSFMTVSTLPLLVDFDVHADCLSYDHLSSTIARTSGTFFPSLEKLRIRADLALVESILHRMPRNLLHSLYIDATDLGSPSIFNCLFNTMSLFPLREFTLDPAIYIGEFEDIPTFTLDDLRPLSKLPLTCFALDSSVVSIDLTDSDMEEITKWWPLLGQLDLGAWSVLENTEATWRPRNSLASLYILARGCQHLKSLVITLDVDTPALLDPPLSGIHPLATLSINSHSRPDIPSVSAMLSKLFPSLVDVTTELGKGHGEAWAAVRETVSDILHAHGRVTMNNRHR